MILSTSEFIVCLNLLSTRMLLLFKAHSLSTAWASDSVEPVQMIQERKYLVSHRDRSSFLLTCLGALTRIAPRSHIKRLSVNSNSDDELKSANEVKRALTSSRSTVVSVWLRRQECRHNIARMTWSWDSESGLLLLIVKRQCHRFVVIISARRFRQLQLTRHDEWTTLRGAVKTQSEWECVLNTRLQ